MRTSLFALTGVLITLGVVRLVLSQQADVPAAPVVGTTATAIAADGSFNEKLTTKIAEQEVNLRLTGTAMRKAFGIKFYRIASYCAVEQNPADVDVLAAVDGPKRLLLVMEKNISENILRKSFEQAFEANDPDKKFVAEIKTMLDYVAAKALAKGDDVVITHLPGTGVEVQVSNAAPIVVRNLPFAHVVWNVYMGPMGVSADLRKGLGEKLGINGAK